MNVTREVINDLWPLYIAGEASADTRALVEAFLRADPEFAELLHRRGEESLLSHNLPALSPDHEMQALRRTKRLLHGLKPRAQLVLEQYQGVSWRQQHLHHHVHQESERHAPPDPEHELDQYLGLWWQDIRNDHHEGCRQADS